MTDMQELFVEFYLQTFNGTQSAIQAGFSPASAGAQAVKLLRKPEIAARIKQRIEDEAMTTDEALRTMGNIARLDPRDFFDFGPDLEMLAELETELSELKETQSNISLSDEIRAELLTRIQDKKAEIRACKKANKRFNPVKANGSMRLTTFELIDRGGTETSVFRQRNSDKMLELLAKNLGIPKPDMDPATALAILAGDLRREPEPASEPEPEQEAVPVAEASE